MALGRSCLGLPGVQREPKRSEARFAVRIKNILVSYRVRTPTGLTPLAIPVFQVTEIRVIDAERTDGQILNRLRLAIARCAATKSVRAMQSPSRKMQ